MLYYIDKLCNLPFPIGLVETESELLDQLTDLGRWTFVAAVTNVDACLYLAFSDLTCHF